MNTVRKLATASLLSCLVYGSALCQNNSDDCESISCIKGYVWDHVDDPAGSDPRLHKARLLLNEKKYEEALSAYDAYLRESTDAARVPEALSESALIIQYHKRSYTDAIDRLQKILTLYPASPVAPQAELRIGNIESGLGKYDKAEGTFLNLLARYPKAPEVEEAQYHLIWVAFNQGDRPSAIATFSVYKKKYPQDARIQGICKELLKSFGQQTNYVIRASSSTNQQDEQFLRHTCPEST